MDGRADDGILYLDIDAALELYGLLIDADPREAADQLRNRAGLEGALQRPASFAFYEDADLALQAAVLAHGIAETQCFIDGNKRLALLLMLTFLDVNGYTVGATDRELADLIISFSYGTEAAAAAAFIRERLRPGSG